jgi:hypothetical protein
VIIHPLHDDIPSMVCYLTPTCNRFTAEDCKERVTKIKELYHKAGLHEIIGPLLVTRLMEIHGAVNIKPNVRARWSRYDAVLIGV